MCAYAARSGHETALDNSPYEAGLVANGTHFDPMTWMSGPKSQWREPYRVLSSSTQYAASRGVKVFYLSNRNAIARREHPQRQEGALALMARCGATD
jgi:predicted secreted acid phosphatase